MQNSANLPFYNYTIVGAGASSLWLANSMMDEGILEHNTLCIVENDPNKLNDRTWCYWTKEPFKEPSIVSKEWKLIKNLYNQKNNQICPYRYCHVSSKDFYHHLKTKLTKNANVSFKSETVQAVTKISKTTLQVQTTALNWESHYVFLSALPSANKNLEQEKLNHYLRRKTERTKKLFLWQSFVGYRIKTKIPVFNPAEMVMMDFKADQANATQFFYELPFSETEALIEFTRFGTEVIDYDYAITQLENRLKSRNVNYEILEIEKGAIPMTPQFDNLKNRVDANQNIIYIGTLGGAIKPTTGYGFKKMFHYGEKLARALKSEGKPNLPTMKRNWRFRMYDIILLQILADTPHLGKNIFEMLFSKQPITRILKFLDEETNIAEEILIFAKLPLLPFIKSLLKFLFVR